jgi:cytochrome c
VQAPHLGKAMSAEDVAKWQLNVFPDGTGLPVGKGTAAQGKPLFDTLCASCHGENGRGNTADELVGEPKPPTKDNPSKVIGSYWPYATTLYDFIRRSMPPTAPGSLKPDEIYALIAYLLNANGITGEADVMSNETLAKVQMPNRDGFVWVDVKR